MEMARENKATQYIMGILNWLNNYLDLQGLIIGNMQNMLILMEAPKRAERELAVFILYGLGGALPILAVPFITGYLGYIVLYPLAVGILIFQQFLKLQRQYRNWQVEITKDLPELIDKLRISFASGRDYIAAFAQARESSGPRMKNIIDKLIHDLQCMRPAQALDHFADAFKMPVVSRFASAVKIAVEYGYDASESYFKIIENDITEVRRVAIEELTKSKPEKVYQLYFILIALAGAALLIKGWEIFSQIEKII